jgi:hypothetical protein
MSNALTEARTKLRDLLKAAGLNAFTVAPNPITPPFAYVGPNEPYLDYEGAGFGCVIARFQVGYVTAPGVNEKRAEDVDDGLLTVLAALRENPEDPHGFFVEGVDRPGPISLPGAAGTGGHIAAPINVAIELDLGL